LTGRSARYHKISYSTEALDRLLGELFLESHSNAPEQIVLDLDATDIPLYGHQPERFFHGYYDSYCYSQWENPRLCRGGSSSLTFPGVHPETLRREPPSTPQGETGWTSMQA
jgi:hypothetical protein